MKQKKDKLKQSETVVIKRSNIHFAAYNPRKKNPEVVKKLKENFKKVGFLGGIAWNPITGNLIGGHKRLEALDLIHGYSGDENTNYDVKVEKIELDEKTEKEQNIFLNSKSVQGETDFDLLSKMICDIDYQQAGLTDYDISVIEAVIPNFNFGNNEEIKKEISELNSKEKKDNVKNIKAKLKDNVKNSQNSFYIVVTFKTNDEKAEFLEGININGDSIYIDSDTFLKKLNEE